MNDSCSSITPVLIPSGTQYLFTGDNTGGTSVGDAVTGSSTDDGFARVWHAFILQDCGDVTVEYCGNTPVMTAVSSALITSCPADDPVILADAQSTILCGDGNMTLTYSGLAAGVYYLPVFSVFTPLGPYEVLVGVATCSGAPPNDECAGAYPLMVHPPDECPSAAVLGNNAASTASSPPPDCLGSATYVDVWYRFETVSDTALLLHAETISASEIGVEVLDACGGNVIYCSIDSLLEDTLVVLDSAFYHVRVFTRTDTGVPGTFGICIGRLPAAAVCDGGSISFSSGDTALTVCVNGAPDPVTLEQNGVSTASYVYFLCTAEDTVLTALNGDSLQVDTLPPGTYHLHGFSFDGTVADPFVGQAMADITATGACDAASSNFIVLTAEICSGIEALDTDRLWIVPNPAGEEFDLFHSAGEPLSIVIADASGREVWRHRTNGTTTVTHVRTNNRMAPGLYTIRCTGQNIAATAALVIQ